MAGISVSAILEIGCGVGGIINLLEPRELIYGLDVESDVLEYATERFQKRPECKFALLDINNTTPEKFAELQANRFDSIVCINVLEHIEDDVAACAAWRVCCNRAAHWPCWCRRTWRYVWTLRQARWPLSPLQQGLLSQDCCANVVANSEAPLFQLPGAMGWWVQYKLLKRTIHGEGQFGIMNYALPVVRLLEKICPPLFGLSLVTVCQKPA